MTRQYGPMQVHVDLSALQRAVEYLAPFEIGIALRQSDQFFLKSLVGFVIEDSIHISQQVFPAAGLIQLQGRLIGVPDDDLRGELRNQIRMSRKILPEIRDPSLSKGIQLLFHK